MSVLSRTQRLSVAGTVLFTVLAGVTRYASGVPALLAFAAATAALAGLAWIVSFATENVGVHFGPAATGVMQSTVGNLPEFFIVVFALDAGEVLVAQTSIVGSIFANALLVLGAVIVVGARTATDGVMRFRTRLPQDTATLMILTSFIIALVAISLSSHDPASHHIEAVSTIAAVTLLVVYLAWVIPYVRREAREAEAPGRGTTDHAELPLGVALPLLAAAGAGSAFVSDWFIHALEPAIRDLGVSKAFAGIVIVAIAGNAVENVAGLVLARKGQSDLAISVVKNSVAQVAAFLFPLLVLVSLLLPHSLTFALAPVYVGATLLSALAIWQVTGDGEAVEFEGWALIGLYVVLATLTLYE